MEVDLDRRGLQSKRGWRATNRGKELQISSGSSFLRYDAIDTICVLEWIFKYAFHIISGTIKKGEKPCPPDPSFPLSDPDTMAKREEWMGLGED